MLLCLNTLLNNLICCMLGCKSEHFSGERPYFPCIFYDKCTRGATNVYKINRRVYRLLGEISLNSLCTFVHIIYHCTVAHSSGLNILGHAPAPFGHFAHASNRLHTVFCCTQHIQWSKYKTWSLHPCRTHSARSQRSDSGIVGVSSFNVAHPILTPSPTFWSTI